MQGHFANVSPAININYPYGLFCDNRLIPNRTDGVSSFNFSDPTELIGSFFDSGLGVMIDSFGSGHITHSGVGVNFSAEAKFGFTEPCSVKTACGVGEVCVVRVSNADQSHVADCNNNSMPLLNAFAYRICCPIPEDCRDGIDNDGDNLIDCTDSDCHDNNKTTVPKRCDPVGVPGNNQSTSECVSLDNNGNVVFSPHCIDNFGDVFYCNYGETDNPLIHPEGFCCPTGQRARQDPVTGLWECDEPTQCGVGDNLLPCFFDFRFDRVDWLTKVYAGNIADWCYSVLPLLTNVRSPLFRSEACCPVIHMGTLGYFVLDDNVKIFGTG